MAALQWMMQRTWSRETETRLRPATGEHKPCRRGTSRYAGVCLANANVGTWIPAVLDSGWLLMACCIHSRHSRVMCHCPDGLYAPLSAQGGCQLDKRRQASIQGTIRTCSTPPPGVTFLTQQCFGLWYARLCSNREVIPVNSCEFVAAQAQAIRVHPSSLKSVTRYVHFRELWRYAV